MSRGAEEQGCGEMPLSLCLEICVPQVTGSRGAGGRGDALVTLIYCPTALLSSCPIGQGAQALLAQDWHAQFLRLG